MVDVVVMPAPNAALEMRAMSPPALEPGAAILETLYSEVCGTDVHLHHGRLSGVPYPIIPGHVSVVRIAEMRGPIVDVEGAPLREGDVVTFLDVHETCNRCWYCLVAKESTRCPSRRVYGITYGANDGLLGGWARAMWMKPGVKLIKLPDSLDPETFIGGAAACTSIHAVDLARIKLEDNVVVAGPVRWDRIDGARSGVRAAQVIVVGATRPAGLCAARGADPRPRCPTRSAASVRRLTGDRGRPGHRGLRRAQAVPQALTWSGTREGVSWRPTDHGRGAQPPPADQPQARGSAAAGIGFPFHRAVRLAARWSEQIRGGAGGAAVPARAGERWQPSRNARS
jgi:hypothetical protein